MKLTASFTKKSTSNYSVGSASAGKSNGDENANILLSSPDESYGRDEILSHSLALTDHIFGIYAIELWCYDERNGKLVNKSLNLDLEVGSGGCGLFIKRKTQDSDSLNSYSTEQAIDAYRNLTDPSRADFLRANDTDVGVGLPGVLWAEAVSSKGMNHPGRTSVMGSLASKRHIVDSGNGCEGIIWRDVDELADDPDQPFDLRLKAFAQSGFKLAAGIPFDINGYRGIVIFFGNPHANVEKLNNSTNVSFMHATAQLIGSSAAAQAKMQEIKLFREKIRCDNWHITKIKVKTIVRFGGSLRKQTEERTKQEGGKNDKPKRRISTIKRIREASANFSSNAKEMTNKAKDDAKVKTNRYIKKVQGGSAGIPPPFSNSQTMLTFFGVFVTHLILSRLNLLIQTESNNELSLILAPLGALTTLQYCLTAAPASQPRNAMFAQLFGVTTAILLCYIPNMAPWFRSALAPAIVIPCMARFGIIHPPAGAAAVVFSSGKYGWEHMGIFLSGVAIAISTAVAINNWSDKRQYPTSWFLIRKAKVWCSREQ